MSPACFCTKTHKWFKRARTGRDSLELTLSGQTPEAHGAGHMSMDGHDGKASRLLCPWPWAQSLCCTKQAQTQHPSLLTARSCPLCPAGSASLPTLPSQGCPARAMQKATLVHVWALCTAWARSPPSLWGSPALLLFRSPVRRGEAGAEALDPMNCIPACASACTSCSFMAIPNTASFPLNYNVVQEDVTNLKEI